MTPMVQSDGAERQAVPAGSGLSLELRCFSYEERRSVLPALLEAVNQSGCWILDRQVLPTGRVEFWFELQLRGVLDLYSAVVASGLELTRAGHRDFTTLCLLRQSDRGRSARGRLLTVRLEVSFIDEDEQSHPVMASRAGLA